jgi:acyl-CoA thioester hydrolase
MTLAVEPSKGIIKDKIFAFPVRIYYEDTDAGGIVYYANYLKFAERARTEFLRSLGVGQNAALSEEKTGFVVRSCMIEYLASAFLDDALTVTCEVSELGGASMTIKQNILRGDDVITKMEVKVVYMSVATHRPTRIPADLTAKIKALVTD